LGPQVTRAFKILAENQIAHARGREDEAGHVPWFAKTWNDLKSNYWNLKNNGYFKHVGGPRGRRVSWPTRVVDSSR